MAKNTNSLPILKFDGADYEYQRIKMKTLLMGKYLWDTEEDEYIEPIDWSVLVDDAKKTMKEVQINIAWPSIIFNQLLIRAFF